MKFYSEITKNMYDTVKDLEAAEKKHNDALKAKEEENSLRKKAADEVTKAYKAVRDAEKIFVQKRNDFVKKYGSFHMTYHDDDTDVATSDFLDLIRDLFDF